MATVDALWIQVAPNGLIGVSAPRGERGLDRRLRHARQLRHAPTLDASAQRHSGASGVMSIALVSYTPANLHLVARPCTGIATA